MFICPLCGYELTSNHKTRHLNYCNGLGPRRLREKKKNPWNKGLTKETDERLEKMGKKITISLLGKPAWNKGLTKETDERVKKHSETCKTSCGGYRPGSGRGKAGYYNGIWCDSSWELAFVIYHMDHNIPFERNKEKFEYIFENKKYTYTPDFKYSTGVYVEIKGRRSYSKLDEINKMKIKSFTKPLLVLFSSDMENMIFYCKKNYGDDFIKMYL